MFRRMLSTAALFAATITAAQAQPVQIQPVGVSADTLPDDFRGKVRYFGNHSGTVTTIQRAGERRRASSACPRPDQGCPERIGGSLEVELEFDGEVVKGVFRGTGGLRDSGLIGRRQGSACRLFDLADGSVWSGRCDSEAFIGTVASVPNAATQLELAFETVGTRTLDYAERERRRREYHERLRRIEFLQALVDGTAPIEQRLDAAVELDSYSWQYDAYRPGSLRNIERGRERDDRYQIGGEFALKNGGAGWVRATVDHGAISCLEFWDAPGVCRPITPPRLPAPPPEEGTPEAFPSLILPAQARETPGG